MSPGLCPSHSLCTSSTGKEAHGLCRRHCQTAGVATTATVHKPTSRVAQSRRAGVLRARSRFSIWDSDKELAQKVASPCRECRNRRILLCHRSGVQKRCHPMREKFQRASCNFGWRHEGSLCLVPNGMIQNRYSKISDARARRITVIYPPYEKIRSGSRAAATTTSIS
jgi:hypothetical protein